MTPWVTRLIIVNAIMYFLSTVRPELVNALAFVPALVLVRPWTILTYTFLHGSFTHILFNMLGLYFFGPRLEVEIGSNHFLGLYCVSGIVGAMLSFVFSPMTPIIGASGSIFGVMLGFAHFWPRERIYIWGVLPVESRYMVVLMTALSLFGGFGAFGDNIAHFAHLGGFAGGYLYLVLMEKTSRRARFVAKMAPPAPSTTDMQRWKTISRERLHEVNRAEFDRIMAKIAATGVASLTDDERGFLDRFSA